MRKKAKLKNNKERSRYRKTLSGLKVGKKQQILDQKKKGNPFFGLVG